MAVAAEVPSEVPAAAPAVVAEVLAEVLAAVASKLLPARTLRREAELAEGAELGVDRDAELGVDRDAELLASLGKLRRALHQPKSRLKKPKPRPPQSRKQITPARKVPKARKQSQKRNQKGKLDAVAEGADVGVVQVPCICQIMPVSHVLSSPCKLLCAQRYWPCTR